MRKTSSLFFSFLLIVCTISAVAPKRNAGGAADTSQFRNLLQQLYDAWSNLDPAQATKFYAKNANLTFFDIKPMKYTGWAEYAAGVPDASPITSRAPSKWVTIWKYIATAISPGQPALGRQTSPGKTGPMRTRPAVIQLCGRSEAMTG